MSRLSRNNTLSRTNCILWHTMVHVPLMFLSECVNFLRRLAFQDKKKLDDSSRLDVVEIARVA